MSIQLELFTDRDVQTSGYAKPESDDFATETVSEQQADAAEGAA